VGKKLIPLLLTLTFFQQAFATHIAGGELYYEYLGPGTASGTSSYRITMKLYKERNAVGQELSTETVIIGIYNSSNTNSLSLVRNLNLTGGSIRTIANVPSANPCLSPPVTVEYQIREFTATTTLPNNSVGYTLVWDRYTRTALDNTSPSAGLGASFITKIPAGGINSSPRFVEKDTNVICKSTPFTLDYSANDVLVNNSIDSISYRFAPAYDGFAGSASEPNPMTTTNINPYLLNSLTYLNPYTGLFPLGSQVTINPQTGLISGTAPPDAGKYVICVEAQEWRNGLLLSTHRKDFIVNVGNCGLNGAQLSPDIWSCDGFTWTFENQSTSSNIISYSWNFGDGQTATNPRPVHTYADTGVYTVKLKVTSTGGCQDSATQRMHVFPGFSSGITYTGSCKNVPFLFSDATQTSYGEVNGWNWNFGVTTTLADTSRFKNPGWTYPDTGTYTVQLISTNSKGCIDTASVNVKVNDKPDLRLPFRDTLICSIDTLQLHAVSGTGQGSFVWAPNYRISSTTVSDPYVNPLTTTYYAVTLSDRGCVATDSIKVNVLDFITVDAGPDTTICRTDSLTLRPISQALSFRWTPTTTLTNPNTKNPIAYTTAASTTYFVQANLGKCQASDEITVKTVPYPYANAGNDTIICYGDQARLNGSINGVSAVWLPSQLVQSRNSLTTLASPRNSTTFVLVVTDTLGCPKPFRDSVLVAVQPQPYVFAGNDTTIIVGQPLVFPSQVSSFLTSYRWTPSTGLNSDTALRPTAVITTALFPASAQLTYRLTATSPEGCNGSDEVTVRIFKTPPSIFVPNAFTPNSDGNNDIIRPILAGMRQLDYFRIYNRLGQLVYSTTIMGQGWDGYIKGSPQGSAGYVYAAQAVDYNGKTVKQTGSFLLVR
jgi:gliding motility-associated-like protein